MMEFYAAYTDYEWLMDYTEQCIRAAVIAAHGTAVISYDGKEVDLSKPFERLTIVGDSTIRTAIHTCPTK
jgi:lysyl-tRNA synthetase class 2